MASKASKIKDCISQARGCIAHAEFSNSDSYNFPDRQSQIRVQLNHLKDLLKTIEDDTEAIEGVADAYAGKGSDAQRLLNTQQPTLTGTQYMRSESAQRERDKRREALDLEPVGNQPST